MSHGQETDRLLGVKGESEMDREKMTTVGELVLALFNAAELSEREIVFVASTLISTVILAKEEPK